MKIRKKKLQEIKDYVKFLYENGRYDECIKWCEPFLFDDIKNTHFLNYLAVSLMKLEYHFLALEYLEKLVSMDNKFSFNIIFIGDIYYNLGKYKLALKEYQRYLEIEPNSPSVVDKCARCLFRMNKIKKAFEYIDKAIEMDSSAPEPILVKAHFLRLTGKKDEAYSLFAEVKKKFPDDQHATEQLFEMLKDYLEKNSE